MQQCANHDHVGRLGLGVVGRVDQDHSVAIGVSPVSGRCIRAG